MSGAVPGLGEPGTQRQVILPLLGAKAAGWQTSLIHQLLHSHSLSTLPPSTRAVSTTGHPHHLCCQGRLAAPGSWALQILTQAPAGSWIKGSEAWMAEAGVCPRGVDAELAAVVQALSTLINVWRG